MKIIFYIILISYSICRLEGGEYDNTFQIKKNEHKVYNGALSTLTVLDISDITENNIYIRFEKKQSFNTKTINYNFTDYFSNSMTYNFKTISYDSQIAHSNKKSGSSIPTVYLYFIIPKEKNKNYLLIENIKDPEHSITIRNIKEEEYKNDKFKNNLGMVILFVAIGLFLIIGICFLVQCLIRKKKVKAPELKNENIDGDSPLYPIQPNKENKE